MTTLQIAEDHVLTLYIATYLRFSTMDRDRSKYPDEFNALEWFRVVFAVAAAETALEWIPHKPFEV